MEATRILEISAEARKSILLQKPAALRYNDKQKVKKFASYHFINKLSLLIYKSRRLQKSGQSFKKSTKKLKLAALWEVKPKRIAAFELR